jgi:NAD(P)-dependent dehydrogenase (short-subunit alcohol dehydrogenase family)
MPRSTTPGTVLVTGASKGIGEACALRLDGLGWRVFAGVRRTEDADMLREKASDRLEPLLLDVTSADQVAAAGAHIAEACGAAGLTAVVNNAGIAIAGPLEFLPVEELRRQLEVNVVGQVAVTQAVLPVLRRARGRIIFVGSIAGRSAMPFTGAYSASKFALEAVADSLRLELRPWDMHVAIVEPGVISTPIWETSAARAEANLARMPDEAERYYGRPLEALRRRARLGIEGLPATQVAEVVEHALTSKRPRTRYVVGTDAELRRFLETLPDRVRDYIVADRLKKL